MEWVDEMIRNRDYRQELLGKGDLRIINLEWLNREIISSIWEKVALGILRIGLFHIYMAR